ncbi:MAG TPA: type VI secretion system baseplate subunit TssF, partial [Myxococcales bacterium]|nr:type VI secretion system baseplate subunit TssF [Myxococcales bacterium]
MFSRYYQSEIAYLREMGRAFGEANPRVAGLLAERGGDPDVERLLEGFAFLTARVRERMDNAVPEIVEGLTELLLPHYLRTVPAASIVEFSPPLRALRGRSRVPAGTELATNPVDGTRCVFRTTFDVDLIPVAVQEVSLDQSVSQAPVLKASFTTTEQGRQEVFQPGGLRLFIHAEPAVGALLLLWMARYCRGLQVRSPEGQRVWLGPENIRLSGLSPECPLLPWPKLAPPGFRLLQEYFTLPQKMLFFDVLGLDAAREQIQGERFDLLFELERPPPLPSRLNSDALRVHCVPVVNLYQGTADPIIHRTLEAEHLVRVAGVDLRHAEVFSVDAVTGVRSGRATRRTFQPFVDFSHASSGTEEPAFFRLRRTLSPIDDWVDTFLSIGTPADVSPELGEETLSLELTCTNRSLPTRLQVGDICAATASSPTIAKFRNIVAVTRPLRPPLGMELQWRLLSHLSLNQRSLLDGEALRSLLEIYNFQEGADEPTARANQLRAESIRGVDSQPCTRFLEGAPVRGRQVRVDASEAGFAGVG